MTRSSRLRLQAAVVAALGAFALVTAPRASEASVGDACFSTCLAAVAGTSCPPGYWVHCDVTLCVPPEVAGVCVWDI